MSQFAPVLTSRSYKALLARRSAMADGAPGSSGPAAGMSQETYDLAQSLMLHVPEFEWTIEVDVLGSHRVTLHFKGAEISVDEPVH